MGRNTEVQGHTYGRRVLTSHLGLFGFVILVLMALPASPVCIAQSGNSTEARPYSIQILKTERFGYTYIITLEVAPSELVRAIKEEICVGLFYLQNGSNGEAAHMAINWRGKGDLIIGASPGPKGSDFEGNVVSWMGFGFTHVQTGKKGAFVWIGLKPAPVARKTLRVPVGDCFSGLGFDGSGPCAVFLLTYGGQVTEQSNIVETRLDFSGQTK